MPIKHRIFNADFWHFKNNFPKIMIKFWYQEQHNLTEVWIVLKNGVIVKRKSYRRSPCLSWSKIGNYSTEAYKDFGLEKNYCRNPDNRAAPYCYTKFERDEIRWEY